MRMLLLFAAIAVILILIRKFVPHGKKIALYAVLIIVALIMLLPFYTETSNFTLIETRLN